jgi:hypothetical protein
MINKINYDEILSQMSRYHLDIEWIYTSLAKLGLEPKCDLKKTLSDLEAAFTTNQNETLFQKDIRLDDLIKLAGFLSNVDEEKNRLLRQNKIYDTTNYTHILSKLEHACFEAPDISEGDKIVIADYLALKRKEANPLDKNAFFKAFREVKNIFKADYLILTHNYLIIESQNSAVHRKYQKKLEAKLPGFINSFPDEYTENYIGILKLAQANGFDSIELYELADAIPRHFPSGKEDIYFARITHMIEKGEGKNLNFTAVSVIDFRK